MTTIAASLLSAAIINFCGLKNPQDLQDKATRACADFMVNCAVGPNGEIEEKTVARCKKTWTENSKQLIQKSLED